MVLVKHQHVTIMKIFKTNRGKIDELANYLYKKNIRGKEFIDILNR